MEALTVSESNLAGWRWFERKQHAEISTDSFGKSGKNMKFWPIYGFLAYWRVFGMTSAWRHQVGSRSGDVSMTSSGDVASYDWSTGIVRWRTYQRGGGRRSWCGGGVAVTWWWQGHGKTGGKRKSGNGFLGPPTIRRWFCQRATREIVRATRGRGLTSPSDSFSGTKCRTSGPTRYV